VYLLAAVPGLITRSYLKIPGDRLHFYELNRRATPHLGVVVTLPQKKKKGVVVTISIADSDGFRGISVELSG
jgi:hypothetical protein